MELPAGRSGVRVTCRGLCVLRSWLLVSFLEGGGGGGALEFAVFKVMRRACRVSSLESNRDVTSIGSVSPIFTLLF